MQISISSAQSISKIEIGYSTIKQFPNLFTKLYERVASVPHSAQLFILGIGIFYCLAGVYFQFFSQVSLISLLIFATLDTLPHLLDSITLPLDSLIKTVAPEEFCSFVSSYPGIIGLVICSVVLALFLTLVLNIHNTVQLSLIFYTFYMISDIVFSQFFTENVALYSLLTALLICFIIFQFKLHKSKHVVGFTICFLGSMICFMYLTINVPQFNRDCNVFKQITSFDFEALKNPSTFIILLFSTSIYLLQCAMYKI